MNIAQVYPSEVEAQQHVLEPLTPMIPSALRRGRDVRRATSYTREHLDEAVQEARKCGMEEGRALVNQELLRVVHAMAEAVRRETSEYEAALQSLQQDAIGLSLAIARQVVMSELSAKPETIADVLSALLEEAEGRKVFSVTLNPEDMERIKNSNVGEIISQAGIKLRPSAEISPGGCVLDTGFGKLDARIETRMEEISASLLGHGAATNKTDIEIQ